jgi:hypothetical protein
MYQSIVSLAVVMASQDFDPRLARAAALANFSRIGHPKV